MQHTVRFVTDVSSNGDTKSNVIFDQLDVVNFHLRTNGNFDRRLNTHRHKQTNTDAQTDRQTDRQTDTQAVTHTQRFSSDFITIVARRLTRNSATTEIVRDADDVDYEFSEATVYLTKKCHRIPFRIHPVICQIIYRRTPNSSNHVHTQRCPCALRLLTQPRPVSLTCGTVLGTHIKTTAQLTGEGCFH